MNQTLRLNVEGILAFFLLLTAAPSFSQSTGFINQQATSVAGRLVLDPNNDGYTSSSTTGFGLDDVANSEIPYKLVKSYSIEPFGDLRRGPSHRFSDFVPDGNYVGFYTFFTGTNLLFRLRMGSVMSGSKGYSLLLDTDGKFGATGPNADPNYQAATTGTNGNPGFEIEIVLETNFRLAIYNVDGTSSPTLIKAYTNWQDYSQVSIAASFDNGDPDFFRDFFIPFSDLQAAPFNLTTSSPIRMVPTTVMSPQGAIGGPKSDIYGLDDSRYPNANDQYEDYINGQPPFTLNDLTTGGPGLGNMCTAAPTINSPISTGTVNINGTWTKSSLSGSVGTAAITVYKNGSSIGIVNGVTTGSTWTLNNIVLISGDIITAKAQAAGESMCLVSNAVMANNCNSSNRPAKPIFVGGCAFNKGVSGTNLTTGWQITVENMSTGLIRNSITDAGMFAYSGASPSITWAFDGGCSGGPNRPPGSYKVYYTNASGCISEPEFFCYTGNGGGSMSGVAPAPVVITNPSNNIFTTAIKTIEGTADANGTITLYKNGIAVNTTTASGTGNFTFSNVSLLTGDMIYITNVLITGIIGTSKCLSSSSVFTVSCYNKPPLINADNNNQITAGLPITGTSSEPTGSTIRVYTTTPTLVATTAVQANGTWSTGNAGTTPATYNAVNATNYYATAQKGTCSASQNSGTVSAATPTSSGRCGTITGPVDPNATSISGTVTGSFTTTTINLYLDGTFIGSTTTTTTNWGPITVNSTINNALYSNGVLTISIQETAKQEVNCPASATTITCTPTPVSPVISPTTTTIAANQSTTYTISNAVAGTFYGIANSTTGESLANGIWATTNGNLTITTKTFASAGTYPIVVKATSLSGVSVCTSLPAAASLTVSSTLPVSLKNFNAKWVGETIALSWETTSENNSLNFTIERSADGNSFSAISTIAAAGNSQVLKNYSYIDLTPFKNYNYYRLKMNDNDGKNVYSKVILLQKNVPGILINSIRPNPFINELAINVVLDQRQPVVAIMLDASGKIVKTFMLQGLQGLNNFKLISLEALPPGIYIMQLRTADKQIQEKVIKVL